MLKDILDTWERVQKGERLEDIYASKLPAAASDIMPVDEDGVGVPRESFAAMDESLPLPRPRDDADEGYGDDGEDVHNAEAEPLQPPLSQTDHEMTSTTSTTSSTTTTSASSSLQDFKCCT